MVKVNFYFIRHGYSCSNLKKQKKRVFEQKQINDPHLTNWGLIGSLITGIILKKQMGTMKFKYLFCSTLLRTWETSLAVFSNTKNKQVNVAPYLREYSPGLKNLSKIIYTTNDNPKSFHKNQERLLKFRRHIHKLYNRFLKIDDKTYLKKLELQTKNTSNVHVKFHKKRYSSKYTDAGDLNKFIQWYLNKMKPKKNHNIAVVTHGTLLRMFLKSYHTKLHNNLHKTFRELKANNIIVKVETEDNEVKHIEIFFNGIKYPTEDELNNIRSDCSICKTLFSFKNTSCEGNKELSNYTVHDNLIKKYIE